ncbi:unnamed protein product [Moneuplotes crassus]|uniref:Kinetochore protein NDC80 n=1 Tax=Euplotes crassus TaxID=5936 RepID=A0AAD1X283_EUPCR|nr:unnamed protein product [Moneuplotes crassus]
MVRDTSGGSRFDSGRKSMNTSLVGLKKHRGGKVPKDSKKFSKIDSQRQVREKIISILKYSGRIKSESDLDFKIMDKTQNSVFKTLTILISIMLDFEVKKVDDVYSIAYKIFQYPYEISQHAFVPLGAPNTWSQLVYFFDWIADILQSYLTGSDDAIMEESEDDEYRRSSMDRIIEMESSQFFDHLPNAPTLKQNSRFMKYIEKMRNKQRFEESKGFNSQAVPDPQKLLEEETENIRISIGKYEEEIETINHKMNERVLKRQKIEEMENNLQALMDQTKSVQDAVNHLNKSLESRRDQEEQLSRSIEEVNTQIKSIQTNIDQQMYTAFEKEMAVKNIEDLGHKKSALEKKNSTLNQEISEGNREIHLDCLQSISKTIAEISEELGILDQQENFDGIIKSMEIDAINSICSELVTAIRDNINNVNLEKEALVTDQMSAENEYRKLQSDYSTKKVEYDNEMVRNQKLKDESDQLQESLNSSIRPDGTEMKLKRELSEKNNEKLMLIKTCQLKREKVKEDLEVLKTKSQKIFNMIQDTQNKEQQLESLENSLW